MSVDTLLPEYSKKGSNFSSWILFIVSENPRLCRGIFLLQRMVAKTCFLPRLLKCNSEKEGEIVYDTQAFL